MLFDIWDSRGSKNINYVNKVFSGYQACKFPKNYDHFWDHLSPHHQDSNVTMRPDRRTYTPGRPIRLY